MLVRTLKLYTSFFFCFLSYTQPYSLYNHSGLWNFHFMLSHFFNIRLNVDFICSFFWGGCHTHSTRGFRLCAQESFLIGVGTIWDPGWPYARQMPDLLYYRSGPDFICFFGDQTQVQMPGIERKKIEYKKILVLPSEALP